MSSILSDNIITCIRRNKIKHLLPTGYTQLKWIQSDGNSKLDSKVIITDEYYIIGGNIQLIGNTKWQSFFTSYIDENTLTTRIIRYENETNRVLVYYLSKAGGGGNFLNVDLSKLIEFEVSYNKGILNNNVIDLTHTQGKANNASIKYTTSAKLYRQYIKYKDKLIRDFIPCINPKGIVGFYDIISKEFYSSYTNVQFIAGDKE